MLGEERGDTGAKVIDGRRIDHQQFEALTGEVPLLSAGSG